MNARALELSGQLRDSLEAPDEQPTPVTVEFPGVGLHRGIPALAYHAWPGASQSTLKIMRDRSPLHARWAMDHPQQSTDALIVGAAIHTCVLEPDLFPTLYAFAGRCEATKKSDGQQCSNTGTVRRDGHWFCNVRGHDPVGFNAPGDPVIALREGEYNACIGIRDSVRAHPATQHMLEGDAECSAVWEDPETGVLSRGRFDDLALGIGAITDLKSAVDASPLTFRRSLYRFGYHIQGAMYIRGAQTLGMDVDSFGIIAVEKDAPYAVAVYQLEAAALFDGARELDALLARWAECESTGVWPCYDTEVVKLDLPKWAPNEINERIGE